MGQNFGKNFGKNNVCTWVKTLAKIVCVHGSKLWQKKYIS
jgi:hypothetical protein